VIVQFLVGVVVVGVSILALWWVRRRRRTVASTAVRFVATGLLGLGVATVGIYVWALSATDTSQFARAIVWGSSGFGDQERFPSRPMAAADDPLMFSAVNDSPVGDYVNDHDVPLDQLLESNDTTAFIVLHADELLYEGYFNGSSRESLQTSFSVAKSFTATLVGIAIEEGSIGSLEDPVTVYLPELAERDDRFGDITLQHLITMSSGLSFQDGSSPWADPANTYYGIDLRSAAIDKPGIDGPPGVVFDYNDWDVILLGLVLERSTGLPVAEYAETRLWQPMGAEGAGSWSIDSEDHGFEKMFVGVNGRAIDFAKLGWLYLNDGRNGTRQVVPERFVAEATREDTSTDPAPEYQYLWWIDHDRESYFANGDHGQFIYIDPNANLVIVRHGRGVGDLDWVRFMGDLAEWIKPQLSVP
jgi:CubicO group peptidase (beta-lactamase class C family)